MTVRKLSLFILMSLALSCAGADGDESDDPSEEIGETADKLNALKTDRNTHRFVRPSSPPVGRNSKFTDPEFGTRILRVTDSYYGSNCTNQYSYYPSLNVNNTRLLVLCDNFPYIVNFDPTNVRTVGEKYSAIPNYKVQQITDFF